MMILLLHVYTLNYNRINALCTRTIIRNALIDVIKKERCNMIEWNVQVVMQMKGQLATSRRTQARQSRRGRKKVKTLRIDENT